MSKFISLEGPEGSGKSSVMEKVYERLLLDGYQIVKTREPGGTPIGEQIRNVILNQENTNMDIRTECLLFAASRRQHLVEKIWPALKEDKLVFCDRYLDSSLTYQGVARSLGIENVLNVNLFATENTYPDLTLFFDVAPEIGLSRINQNKDREVNRLDKEKLDFHKKVYQGYQILLEKYPERIKRIDASKPFSEVVEQTYRIIKENL